MKLRSFIKKIIPYSILKIFYKINKSNNIWEGNYPSWEAALKQTSGYDTKTILEKVKSASLKVKSGEAVFERDSVLFYKQEYNYQLLTILLKVALENKSKLNVVDFGGSLGSTFVQHKFFLLPIIKDLKWYIVEQNDFVLCGKTYFEDDNLKFRNSINDIYNENKQIDILYSSCALPYIENPLGILKEWINLGIKYIYLEKIPFIMQNDQIKIQNVPKHIYDASYPTWFFNKDKFNEVFKNHYNLDIIESNEKLPFTDAQYYSLFFSKKIN